MPNSIFYLVFLFFELIFTFSIAAYLAFLVYSSIMGSPYVVTKQKEVDLILREAHLKKDQFFLELGSGDSRVVRTAVNKYQVRGLGIDINPILTFIAKIKSKIQKLKNIEFQTQNIFKVNFKEADVIYIFLMPGLIRKLESKLAAECKKNTLIISHGFKILGLEGKQIKTIKNKPFPTYFYRT